MPGIAVQFLPPNQSHLLALIDDGLKEAVEQLHTIASADTRQARMVGQLLVQVIPQVPADAEPISRMPHQEPFRAYSLKKHDELQFEEHHGINRRTPLARIGLMHKLAHE